MQKLYKFVKIAVIVIISFSILAMTANIIAHGKVFSRADYSEYDTHKFLTYADLDPKQYPRKELSIPSGKNQLTGFLYGVDNTKGLVVISPGHRDCNDIKLYETTYFVDAGWQVLCFDYTGCFTSGGKNMIGYSQSVHDLDAVLDYIEADPSFDKLPVVLFGHSMGGYATGAALKYGHSVSGAIVASGFDTPVEQWTYSIKRYTGPFHYLLCPYASLYARLKYGKDAALSAVDGINSTSIPVLVISGTHDVFYGSESPIYAKQHQITNPNCRFLLEDKAQHNGHYDYFLTDEALAYDKKADSGDIKSEAIDKWLYMEHDLHMMNQINDFMEKCIQ